MLNTIYRDAVKKRNDMLLSIKGPNFDHILEQARKNWIEYTPRKKNVAIAGIDSSFNCVKFQGLELWVVTAISAASDGEIIADLHDHGIGYASNSLSSLAAKMEIKACEMSVDKTDLVLVDGSLYSQFMTRQKKLSLPITNIMKKNQNVIFISKTSNTRTQFIGLKSNASDIFYYNHATKKPGFSAIFTDSRYGKDKLISSIFVRLSESTPIIKLEFFGNIHSENDVKQTIDKIYKNSICGYPYALKLAHQKCKISNNDLAKLVSLYGLSNEIGSREVLE
ncbi:MAG: DNA double-strand break repair nuclease NurA [Nitrosopumilaceae archaeon]|nr:DNA double-strand break repair nuclease NurA [Nitrosopumilaceae archaeon]